MISMKKHLLAGLAVLMAGIASASAQSALFSFDDHNGVANAGTYHPGDSFTFSINLGFTSGGNISNLEGLSYWFQQTSPAGAPFNFAITLRNVSGSQFTDLQSPGLSYPQNLNPSNANDLGALLPGNVSALGSGSYFIADITVSISPSAPITGSFVLSNVFSGGKTAFISDSNGHTFAIPEADYTVTMVPEPATWVAGVLACGAIVILRWRRANHAPSSVRVKVSPR